jgi:hypothetical protein
VAVDLVVDGLVDLPSVRDGSLSAMITIERTRKSGNNTQKMIY